jgi:hypothetical protein
MRAYIQATSQIKYKCRNCGKTFEIPFYCTEWGYWYGAHICCGYSCMRKLQAKEQAKLSMPKAKTQWVMTPKEIEAIERAILKGKSTMVIAKESGRSSSAILKIKRRMVEDGWITKR